MDNANTKDYLDKIRSQVVENLKRTAFAPSVQMTDVPRDPLVDGMDDEADAILDDLDEDENKDKRYTKRRFDQYIEKPGELSDSEDEEENAANGIRRQPNALKRRNQINYRGLDVADSGIESGLATPNDPSSVGDGDLDTAGDTRMGEAPEPDTGSPSAAEPESRAEEASAAEPAEVAGAEQPTSAAISRQPSPKTQEDTTMEDVQAAAPEQVEPKEPEQAEPAEQSQQPEERDHPEQPKQAEVPEPKEAPPSETVHEEQKPSNEPTLPETAAEPSSLDKPQSPRQPDLGALSPTASPAPPKGEAAAETQQEPPKEPAPENPEEATKQE